MSRCEFRAYQTAPKKAGGPPVTEKIPDPFEKLRNGQVDDDHEYALIVRRKYGEKFELESTTLQVNSPHLLGVFRELIGTTYVTVASDFNKPFELESPFQMLFHYVSSHMSSKVAHSGVDHPKALTRSVISGTNSTSVAERQKIAMSGCT